MRKLYSCSLFATKSADTELISHCSYVCLAINEEEAIGKAYKRSRVEYQGYDFYSVAVVEIPQSLIDEAD